MSGQSLDENTHEFEGNDFDSSSNKRMKEMSIDRLSALPDGILIYILSFLGGVKESAVTSVLSKRWEFLWAELPRLDFCEFSREKRCELVSKINRTLLIRTGGEIHLEQFNVSFGYNESFASDVDSWVDFVLNHKVKEVSLRLYALEIDAELYALPDTMFCNSSLTRFTMGRCLMDTLTKIEWPFLTCLHIKDSKLPQHVVESILLGCPVLHSLFLEKCWGFNCLDVMSQNLLKLKVHDREDGPSLEISAPCVHTLDISFNPNRRKLVLKNIKSLVRAKINFNGYLSTTYDVVSSATKELFEIFKDVQELRLGRSYAKVLSELVFYGWQLPVSRLKSLKVACSFGIFALLKSSLNLERLAIYCTDHFHLDGDEAALAALGGLDCYLLHLKTVVIHDLREPASGSKLMLKVAQTLLMRAKVLEEMNITFRFEGRSDHNNIGLSLLNYPRSSRKAVVKLHEL